MQDPRVRVAAAGILSISAFISLHGAVLALLWWLVFTPGIHLLKKETPHYAAQVAELLIGELVRFQNVPA